MKKARLIFIILILFLAVSLPALARDYIEVWPEGWSDVTPLFETSIYTNRLFIENDSWGISYLSADGLYFRELDLTYRTLKEQEIEEEVILREKVEVISAFLGLDGQGKRHIAWLEKGDQGNSIYYTNFALPYTGHEHYALHVTTNTVQDLAGFQEGAVTHLVWSERDKNFQIKYAQVVDNELLFVETLTDTTNLSVNPSIIVDDRGISHIVWMETSDDKGVEIYYAQRHDEIWDFAGKIGSGSVQDITQGGLIELASYGDEIFATWATTYRGGNVLFVSLVKINSAGYTSEQEILTVGSRPRFIKDSENPQLVWQSEGQFGTQINYGHYENNALEDEVNLTVGRRGAFRPEVYSEDGFIHVNWLHADSEQGYVLHEINNRFPKKITLWRKAGIDEQAPLPHLFYVFVSTFMMAMVYTVLNAGVMLLGGVLYSFVLRFKVYAKQPLFYRISLMAIILVVVSHLPIPIPSGSAHFFGLVHYGLSFIFALLGTYLFLRRVETRGTFVNIATIIIWMFLFQYFSLIPEVILR